MGYQQPKAPSTSGTSIVEIQNSTYTYAADAQASDSYAITLASAPAAYAAGQTFRFKANTANTGASSLNVNSLGAKTIKKNHDQDTATGDIEAGSIVTVAYDGTNFQMLSSDANLAASEIANTPAGSIAATDVQTALNELDTEKSSTSHNHSGVYEPANANIQSHIANTSNPHSVTQSQVGLGNVDNTSDATKNAATATLTNKTLTTPKVGTSINDTNGNEVVKTPATASAVNEVTITNAATGNAPQVSATGDDTNIDLKLAAKGTGKVAPQSSVNFGAKTAYFTETDNGNSSTADTIDWGLSNKQKSTLTGNCTFTFTAPSGSCSLVLKLVQDATGSRTVTWPASVHWSGGTAPTLTTTASKVDIITFYYDGSTYFGNYSLNFTA